MLLLVGKSASGKDTVKKELIKMGMKAVVTYATRPPRNGEIDGVTYHFITKEEFLNKELPEVKLISAEATYLLWLDCKEISNSSEELNNFICDETGLRLSSGNSYGECGDGFLRMNIACPRERLIDGLNRLKKSIDLKLTSARNMDI